MTVMNDGASGATATCRRNGRASSGRAYNEPCVFARAAGSGKEERKKVGGQVAARNSARVVAQLSSRAAIKAAYGQAVCADPNPDRDPPRPRCPSTMTTTNTELRRDRTGVWRG